MKKLPASIHQLLTKQSLDSYAEYATKEYGMDVLENRVIPDYRDGLKPVQRAILWSMYKLNLHSKGPYKKAARTVGDCIGQYSPHGDAPTYDAMIGLANTPIAMVDGYGNWGSHVDSAAAYRYTEARLSEFSEKYLLDPEYLAVVHMRPNFSEDLTLPTVLPSKVPNVLLSSNTSIAVGMSASSPSFHIKGVLKLSELCLNGTKLTPELCYKYLIFHYKYGGKCVSSKAELMHFFKVGKGSLKFEPEYDYSLQKREFVIRSTCPGLSSANTIQGLLDKISNIPSVKLVFDDADKDGIKYVVQFGKVGDDKIKIAVDAIIKLCIKSESFDFGVAERLESRTTIFRVSPITVIEKWCKWRVEIERLVLVNRITKCENTITSLKLMVLAVDNLGVIVKALEKDDSEDYLVTKLKITQDQASIIMDMRLKSLKKLEKTSLKSKLFEASSTIKKYKEALKDPKLLILDDFKSCLTLYA